MIQKRTREEVSWNNSTHPWTRSPLWLLLRVGKAKPIALALDPLTLPTVNRYVNNDNKSFELAALETWVQHNLGTWLEHRLSSEQSCHGLNTLLEHYHISVEKWYTGRPERLSKLLLTLGEIWVAIDKMAVHHNPLMLKYRNEIPREVFSDLLLHSKTDMERLHRLEEYLDDTSGTLKLSALLSYGQRLSFAVEYCRQCPELQEKKEEIEHGAHRDRDKKLKQFRELKAKYDAIMKQYDDMRCEKVLQVQYDVEYYEFISSISVDAVLSPPKQRSSGSALTSGLSQQMNSRLKHLSSR